MRQVLAILQKDLKHLWPFGSAVAAMIALHGWIDLQMDHGSMKVLNMRFAGLEPQLLSLAWWCLVGSLIQQEQPVGDRQYWVSRPVSRLSIVAAKAIFLVIFVCAPNLLSQGVVLSLTGFPPRAYLGSLFWNQTVLFVYLVVAAAFASVTRSFRQYAVTSLVVFVVAGFLLVNQLNSPGGQWMGVQWVSEIAGQLALLLGGVMVLAIQYRLRRTGVARLAMGATVVTVLLLLCGPWWHTAFAVTAAVGAHEAGASRIQIDFEPPPNRAAEHSDENYGSERVALPVRITGIPNGHQLTSERLMVTVEAAGTEEWHSAWQANSTVANHTDWRHSEDWLAVDGSYWLSFDIPTAELDRVRGKRANVRADVAFSLFSAPAITRLPPRPRAYPVPDAGHCTLEQTPQFRRLSCVNPFQNRVSLNLRVPPHGGGQPRLVSFCCEISYSPLPAVGLFSVWTWGSMAAEGLSDDDEISVEVRRPMSFFERHLVIDAIPLTRFAVARSRP